MCVQCCVFRAVFERCCATIRCVLAGEGEVAAALAGRLAVAFDFAALAFVAGDGLLALYFGQVRLVWLPTVRLDFAIASQPE